MYLMPYCAVQDRMARFDHISLVMVNGTPSRSRPRRNGPCEPEGTARRTLDRRPASPVPQRAPKGTDPGSQLNLLTI